MKKKINNFKPFSGQHCETTATGTLLNQLDIDLSEPLLFGLGEGLGFIFWNMKNMDMPFIGGRIKPDQITTNLCRNLHLNLHITETSSVKKAWQLIKQQVDNNILVGLKLDCYHLEYFTNKFHFAAHYAAFYGYDADFAYLIDTLQQGQKVKTSLSSLETARNERGPMSSKNLSYTITVNDKYNIKEAVQTAIKNNAVDYLNPPINNINYKGIIKTSKELIKWFKISKNIESDFCTTAALMEKAGTGGALFRNLYRDFLKESWKLLDSHILKQAYLNFKNIAEYWKTISSHIDQAGKTKNIQNIEQAAKLLLEVAQLEKTTFENLTKISD